MSLPVASPTKPFWLTAGHSLSSHRSTAELPLTQDVLIIGAGFAGAACAYYLTQAPDAPASVTILEARDACSGATGRNGGHVRPESLATFAKFGDRLDVANEIAKFEIENAAAVAKLVQELDIDCDFEEITSSNAYLDQNLADAAKDLRNRLVDMGYEVAERFTYHEADTAADVTGVPGAKGAMTFPAACIWPYKFVMHLLSLAVQKGVNLQTNTPVLSISPEQDADGYWSVTTERGPTRAKNIIFATNGYTRHLLPSYTGKIIPTRGICGHIKADAMPKLAPSMRTMGIKYSPGCQDYLISRADGSIIVGGAWKVVRPGPKEDWSDVIDDSKLVPAAETYYDGFMERTFASWRTVPSQVDHLWTGIMGYTSDGVPHVGRVDEQKPGLLICAGFNGHGMPQVLLCAKGLVKMVIEGCSFGETGIPSSFQTGRA